MPAGQARTDARQSQLASAAPQQDEEQTAHIQAAMPPTEGDGASIGPYKVLDTLKHDAAVEAEGKSAPGAKPDRK